jgi:hypothetical protein
MPGDRFPIDSVVHGEYMKWSIVEARVGSENPWNLWELWMKARHLFGRVLAWRICHIFLFYELFMIDAGRLGDSTKSLEHPGVFRPFSRNDLQCFDLERTMS